MADPQAQVTLTSVNAPSIVPEKRVLQLSSSRRTIPIGRASKSINKGLIAREDNAWFDSPVMSRNHAEISLHSDNKTVQLRDIGSMHGTILNDEELKRKELRPLTNGDIVKFGAEVRRGSETFPACSFKVEYEFNPNKTAVSGKSFQAPESSDLEDEANYSDNEDMSDVPGSSNEGVGENASSESPLSKRSISVEIVGSFSGPKGLTEDQAVEDMMNMKKSSQSSTDLGNANNPVVVDSDDDQETDEEMDEEMSDSSGNPSESDEVDIADLADSPAIPRVLMDFLDSESESEVDRSSPVIIEEVRRLSDNKGIKISDIRSTRPVKVWGELEEAEDASDSESEAESNDAADRRSVIVVSSDAESDSIEDSEDNDSVESVNGEVGPSYQASEPESEAVEESEADLSTDEDSDMGVIADSDKVSKYEIFTKALAPETEKEPTSKPTPTMPAMAPWNLPSINTPEKAAAPSTPNRDAASFGREPSPSDAAMVKEDATATTDVSNTPASGSTEQTTVNPTHVHLWAPRNVVAQSMSETGKADFFQAREENRAHVATRSEAVDDLNKSPTLVTVPSFVPRPTWSHSVTQTQPPPVAFRRPPGVPLYQTVLEGVQQQRERQQERERQHERERQQERERLQERERERLQLQRLQQQRQQWPTSYRSQQQQLQQQQNLRHQADMIRMQAAMVENHRQRAIAANTGTLKPQQTPSTPQSATRNTLAEEYLPRLMSPKIIDQKSTLSPSASKTASLDNLFEKRPSRSSVPISDLVERSESPAPQAQQSLKRKADAISNSGDENVSIQPPTSDTIVAAEKSTKSEATGETTLVEVASSPTPLMIIEEPIVRAPKRMRRFVEAVGYAALGGAAVGAGLFSVLVATAPDFL